MDPVTLRVREAVAADAAWLCACAIAMAKETEGRALDPATIASGVANGLADPAKARYFVAMRDARAGADTIGVPSGTLMLTREWSDWRDGDWWWIQSVYVMPEYRRHGVFAALYRHVESLARAQVGVIGLRLYAEHNNTGAQDTYTRLGMHEAGYRVYEAML